MTNKMLLKPIVNNPKLASTYLRPQTTCHFIVCLSLNRISKSD